MSNPFLNKFNLTGKTALITGSAGLLGYEHAMALLEIGANIIITDINKRNLSNLYKNLKSKSYKSKLISKFLDVTSIESVNSLKEVLNKEEIQIDILINNAAINPKVNKNSEIEGSRLENYSNEQWDLEIAVGLKGAFNCSKVFGYEMSKKGGGVIVNIASDLSVIAPDNRLYKKDGQSSSNQPVKPVSYSVIKHGLIGLTKYLATYWPDKGVRCNALSPGGIFNDQGEEFLNRVEKLIPFQRMAYKNEYHGAIQFLCSDASSYMNGHNLVIDGGRSIW
tara:strand:+ start:127 stop:963 length:837 start_codon:yes stop_codon:yes gene_type:complete